MVKKARKKVRQKLIKLTKKYFDSLVNSDYDEIYEELITDESANLLSATAWALICYEGDNLDFLVTSEYVPNPEVPVHDALSLAFQMDIEKCRTGLFQGLAEATLRQKWQDFDPKDLLCFVDNKAAILIASSPTAPVLMPFVKQDGEYLIDFEALWLFSMGMRASILSEIASYAHKKGNNDLAAEFFAIASNLALPYQRITRLMLKNPFVGQIITPKRKQEIIDELRYVDHAKENLKLLETSTQNSIPLDEYEKILEIASNMATVMERSPEAFKGLGEEHIRQHFLVHLNGHFAGDATGETFNYHGKTDILIRRNNLNLFVAECKFWHGEKAFSETIDQLLTYATWHDTRLAIFLFNRNRNLSNVLSKVSETIKLHANYIREIEQDSETKFRFFIKHDGDGRRELMLTVLVFDVPG